MDVSKKRVKAKKTDTWLKYRGTIEHCLRIGMSQKRLWEYLNTQYEYVATFPTFHNFLVRYGFVQDPKKKKELECVYPNCFKCPFDDCIKSVNDFVSNVPSSEQLYKMSHGE